jgi:hypothetical protein
MKRLVISKISNNPQTEAGIVLLALIKTIFKTDKKPLKKDFKNIQKNIFPLFKKKQPIL